MIEESDTGFDVIMDFNVGVDRIVLNGFGAALDSFADVIAAASQSGANTVIDIGGGDTLLLSNVDMTTLTAGDFIFG